MSKWDKGMVAEYEERRKMQKLSTTFAIDALEFRMSGSTRLAEIYTIKSQEQAMWEEREREP